MSETSASDSLHQNSIVLLNESNWKTMVPLYLMHNSKSANMQGFHFWQNMHDSMKQEFKELFRPSMEGLIVSILAKDSQSLKQNALLMLRMYKDFDSVVAMEKIFDLMASCLGWFDEKYRKLVHLSIICITSSFKADVLQLVNVSRIRHFCIECMNYHSRMLNETANLYTRLYRVIIDGPLYNVALETFLYHSLRYQRQGHDLMFLDCYGMLAAKCKTLSQRVVSCFMDFLVYIGLHKERDHSYVARDVFSKCASAVLRVIHRGLSLLQYGHFPDEFFRVIRFLILDFQGTEDIGALLFYCDCFRHDLLDENDDIYSAELKRFYLGLVKFLQETVMECHELSNIWSHIIFLLFATRFTGYCKDACLQISDILLKHGEHIKDSLSSYHLLMLIHTSLSHSLNGELIMKKFAAFFKESFSDLRLRGIILEILEKVQYSSCVVKTTEMIDNVIEWYEIDKDKRIYKFLSKLLSDSESAKYILEKRPRALYLYFLDCQHNSSLFDLLKRYSYFPSLLHLIFKTSIFCHIFEAFMDSPNKEMLVGIRFDRDSHWRNIIFPCSLRKPDNPVYKIFFERYDTKFLQANLDMMIEKIKRGKRKYAIALSFAYCQLCGLPSDKSLICSTKHEIPSQELRNIKLQVNNQVFMVCKETLCKESEFFKNLFSADFKESCKNEFLFPNHSKESFEILIDFLHQQYPIEILIEPTMFIEVLKLANELNCIDLLNHFINLISKAESKILVYIPHILMMEDELLGDMRNLAWKIVITHLASLIDNNVIKNYISTGQFKKQFVSALLSNGICS